MDPRGIFPGVVATPDLPGPILAGVRAKALSMVGDLPPGAHGAVVGIITDDGTGPTENLAILADLGKGIDVAGYVGKKWGKVRPEFGGQIRWTF